MAISTVKATINSQVYNLTWDAVSGAYKGTITAPPGSSYNQNDGHYFPVSITAQDTAGNSTTVSDSDPTLGNSLKLVVKEKVKPVISVVSPTTDSLMANNKPTFIWEVTDDDSGIAPDTISIKLDSGNVVTSGITKSLIANGYRCTYTPSQALSDGAHTAYFNVTDHDGNTAIQVITAITIDTTPPVLTLSSPVDNLVTNNPSCVVSGITNDSLSSPVTVRVNGQLVSVSGEGKFSTTLTLTEGENTITVVATDGAGKTSTVTRTVVLDTEAPVFSEVTIAPNPVDAGATYIITVKVTD